MCANCGKHFVGTAAHDKLYRCRYYPCWTRTRYGITACSAEWLPAEELEDAIVKALLATYERHDLFEVAVSAGWEQAQAGRANLELEVSVAEAELTKSEGAVERYLAAFEAGTMSEEQCGPRLRRHGARLAEPRDRRAGTGRTPRRRSPSGADSGRPGPDPRRCTHGHEHRG
ncbi:MAG: recombinase zinc ribbon domain-containing protein [Mycobacteriales bacterium]